MHESTLARQLLQAVVEGAAQGRPGVDEPSSVQRVVAVRAWLAETEALDGDAIRFHFAAWAKGGIAEGAALELTLHHVQAQCEACGVVYEPEHHLTLCPHCDSTEARLLGKTGFGVESIDVE